VDLFAKVEEEVALPANVTGVDAVSAVVCVLGQRLSGGEAADLVQGLPRSVRDRLLPCPRHRRERPDRFGREGLIERVAAHLKVTAFEGEGITRAVFEVVRRALPGHEVRDVASQLPGDLRALWSEPLEAPRATVPPPDADQRPPVDALTDKVLEEVGRSGVLPAGVGEADALSAALCTLSQRLSRGEARHLQLSLPPGLHPLIERCALDRPEEAETFSRSDLLERIAEWLRITPEQAETVATAVFRAVEGALPAQVIRDVASQLPDDLDRLWLGTQAASE
jgi:uncharacterized protein (DUF2267 family)